MWRQTAISCDNRSYAYMNGVVRWFTRYVRKHGNQEGYRALNRLGLDNDLYSVSARPITVSFHATRCVRVSASRCAPKFTRDTWTSIVTRDGKIGDPSAPLVVYSLHCPIAQTMSYVVKSNLEQDVSAQMLFEKAGNMVTSTHPKYSVNKRLPSKAAALFAHLQAYKGATTYTSGWELKYQLLS
eukprot:GHVR01117129.1.p1 GENE.GHVR01117129.1~~GHVR01117129.1.p1  ORF type:complete len:184 (-),score=8.45 GHVR01117129.1:324-875(-)